MASCPSLPPAVSEPAFVGAESSDTPQHPAESNNTEKETLESHEVIELQAFSERKAWIEEKIKVGPHFGLLVPPFSHHLPVSRAVAPH